MSPIEAAVVRRKLRRIRSNAETLRALVEQLTPAAYAAAEVPRRATERLLQEAIDAAVDANTHLLRGLGRPVPEDYFRSFIALGEAGIVDATLAAALAPAAGLRNRIVHEYEELDHALVLQAAKDAPARLGAYVTAVERFLEGQGL